MRLNNEFPTSEIRYALDDETLNNTSQNIDNYSVKLDIQHPFKWIDFSYGTKFSFTTTKNDLLNFNTISGEPIFDPNLSNKFKYKENVQAGYINASKPIGKKLQCFCIHIFAFFCF